MVFSQRAVGRRLAAGHPRDKSTLCAASVGSVTHLGATTDTSFSSTADGHLFI